VEPVDHQGFHNRENTLKFPGLPADSLRVRIVSPWTRKGGIGMMPEVVFMMGLALIDLFWWLRK
jgi:hypothetical protein